MSKLKPDAGKPTTALLNTHVSRIVRTTLPAGIVLLLALLLATHFIIGPASHSHFKTLLMTVIAITTVAWLLGFTLLLSFTFLRQLTLPIEHLAARMGRVNPLQPGKSLIPVPADVANNEIGHVIRATNQLLHKLDEGLRNERIHAHEIEEREVFLEQILDNMAEGIACLSSDGKITRINHAASVLIGRRSTELIGSEFATLLSFGDRPRLASRYAKLGQRDTPEGSLALEASLTTKNGELNIALNLTRLGNDGNSGYIVVFRDISENKRAQIKLKENEERFKLALRATRCGVWDHDLKTGSFWWSPEFLSMLGHDESQFQASLDEKLKLIHPEDVAWVKTSAERYLAQEAPDYNPEYRMKHKDGSWVWVEDRGTAEWDAAGVAIRFSGTMNDCTERKRFEKQMMYMATHDPLTDLPNRTLLNDRIEHALVGNQRVGLMVAVLLLDIDRFKLINDSLGHEIGDQLIRSVAQRLQQNIRPTDTLARLSGDEFVVICEDLPTPQEGARVAKRLLSSMATHFMVDGNQLNIGMSIGISVSPSDGINSQDILRHADTAMHSAKAAGGNCYRFFVAEMNTEAVQRLNMERQIHEGIEKQQFILHYQPKVNIQTREVIGAEALIRWPHRTLGMINPMNFIPVAEETGQVLAIGEWVLREALAQICSWRSRGYDPVPVAVNLSGKQLMAGGVDELILRLLKEFDVPPHLLEIEITESSVMTRMDKVLGPLKRLREEGVGIALDDFGTGYSSLAYLRQLPISELKIDRSFVRDVPDKQEANSIASIILQIGKELGLKVVAEGIETEEQLTFLQERQCDIGQGWLFYKALPATTFEKKLRKIEQ